MQKHLQHDMRRALIALAWVLGLAMAALTATNAVADPGSVHRKNVAVEAKRAEIKSDAASTKFLLGLSAGVRAEIFTLADPYRVVIDLPDVAFQLPEGTGQKGQGLISGFRYGLLAEGKARVVIDTTGPVVLKRADMTSKGGSAVELAIELAPTSAKSFGVGTGGGRAAAAPVKAESAPDAQGAEKGSRQTDYSDRCRPWRHRPGCGRRQQPQGKDAGPGRRPALKAQLSAGRPL